MKRLNPPSLAAPSGFSHAVVATGTTVFLAGQTGMDSSGAIVPGGVVTKPLGDDTILDWIRQLHRTSVITASVCTGAFLLAKAGLLDGLATTTHWENIAALRAAAPDTEVREGVPFVEQGRIITSAGISAGIEMSLHIVGRLAGEGLAQRTARQMAYKC